MWTTAERTVLRGVLLAVVATCWLSATALASFPGKNGRIAFTSVVADEFEVVTVQPDGSGPTPLTGDDSELAALDPAWSPDGSRIAYVSQPDEGPSSVRVMDENGGASVPVDESLGDPREPSWSPDGTTLAWTASVLEGEAMVPGVVAKDVAGNDDPSVLATRINGTISGVAWSPDGRSIAFVWTPDCSECDAVSELYVVAATGGDPTLLGDPQPVGSTEVTGDAAWSPDGTKIAVGYGPGDLRVVSSMTGTTQATIVPNDGVRLTSDSGSHVAWSPDNSQIAFSGAFDTGSNLGTDLLLVSPEGTDVREVPDLFLSDASIDWQSLQAPVTKITAGPAGATTARSARFTFVADKSRVTFQCRLDTRAWTRCASGVQYSALTLGSHVFRVRATESHGVLEEQPPQRTWRVTSVPRPSRPEQLFPNRTGIRARWYRYVSPDHTVAFQSIRAVYIPSGVTIDVRCKGPGCPRGFHREWRTRRFRTSKRVIGGLRGSQLLPHAAVFVTLTKPGYIGIGKMYCIRYNRRVRVRPYELDGRQPICGPTVGVSR